MRGRQNECLKLPAPLPAYRLSGLCHQFGNSNNPVSGPQRSIGQDRIRCTGDLMGKGLWRLEVKKEE